MRLICPAEEPRRDVPALAVVGDDRDGLPIVASQHADDATVPVRLKGNAIVSSGMAARGPRPGSVMLPAVTITRLEKAASDNGFDLRFSPDGDWLNFGSTQTSLQIWLTSIGEALFPLALSRANVLEALTELGLRHTNPLPNGAFGALAVGDIQALHRLLRRAFQLARTLPDELLHVFEDQTAHLPRSTEAERLVIQRVGQDIFRRGLFEYWDGRCAITDLSVPELLRASHIKPWTDCESDAERLDVFNGLLLAPHLDAAFDAGFISVGQDGAVLVSHALPEDARVILGFQVPLKISGLHNAHEKYLHWHRARVFRSASLLP